ncbi:MAG: hypothetical protein M1165_00745 [Candidatus Pacearchaeota archaeon]|nr:hypothetical protein [Candidatus Pacearchaeota archaeon]MDE1848492.1 hypothetical protein [Nanoarchaeota archaeon]
MADGYEIAFSDLSPIGGVIQHHHRNLKALNQMLASSGDEIHTLLDEYEIGDFLDKCKIAEAMYIAKRTDEKITEYRIRGFATDVLLTLYNAAIITGAGIAASGLIHLLHNLK